EYAVLKERYSILVAAALDQGRHAPAPRERGEGGGAPMGPDGLCPAGERVGNPLSNGADRDRTDDIQLAKLALSQLSYGPVPARNMGLDRFELSTPRLSSVCSNQLSYRPSPSPGSYGPESPPSKSKIRRSPFGPSEPDSKPTLISRNHASRGSRELRALTCRCRTRFRLR